MLHDEPAVSEFYPETVAAAERNMAALALVDPGAAFGAGFDPKNFYNPRHRAVFDAARALWERGSADLDPVILSDELAKRGTLDSVGGYAWVSKLGLGYPEASLAERYAEIIHEAYTTRELCRIAAEVPGAFAKGAGVEEVADRLRSFIDRIDTASGASECISLQHALGEEYARIDSDLQRMAEGKTPETGLPTGLGLERVVPAGLPRDRLTLLFGETGTFKTAIKQWVCDAVALAGYHVLDFTLEDSAELTAQRFLARHTGIPYGRIAARDLTDAEVQTLRALQPLATQVAERTIIVGNVPATIEEAIRLSRYWAKKVPLAAVFLDYVQLLEPSNSARDNEAKALLEVCKKAQRAAHRDRLAWVLVSQINRDHSRREDKRPVLNDIYGGSAIQHTTKLAIGIYRPAAHEPEPPPNSMWSEQYHNHPDGKQRYADALELWVRKSVAGESGVVVPVLVDRPTGRITPLNPRDL